MLPFLVTLITDGSREKYESLDYTVDDLVKDTGNHVCIPFYCIILQLV